MYTNAENAISAVKSCQNVFIHTGAAAPQALISELTKQHCRLKDVQIYQLHTEGPAPYADEAYARSFFVNALFVGKNVRDAVNSERGSYIPIFLSEAGRLFKSGAVKLDVPINMVFARLECLLIFLKRPLTQPKL